MAKHFIDELAERLDQAIAAGCVTSRDVTRRSPRRKAMRAKSLRKSVKKAGRRSA